MPQPLSTKKYQQYAIRSSVFHARPDHSRIVMQIIASWSVVDTALAKLMPIMLHAHSRPVLEMISKLRSASALRDISNAAATALPEHFQLPFAASMRILDRARKKRNIFAHHIYGDSSRYPDCIFTVDPVTIQEHQLEYDEWQKDGVGNAPEIERSKIMVWTLDDLQGVLDQIDEALNVIGTLSAAVQQHVMPLDTRANAAPEGDAYKFLMRDNLVLREMEQISKRQR